MTVKPTLHDVAARADLSIATVSRALNGLPVSREVFLSCNPDEVVVQAAQRRDRGAGMWPSQTLAHYSEVCAQGSRRRKDAETVVTGCS